MLICTHDKGRHTADSALNLIFSKKLKMISNAMIELVLCQTPKETHEKQTFSKKDAFWNRKRKTETICKKNGKYEKIWEIKCQHAKKYENIKSLMIHATPVWSNPRLMHRGPLFWWLKQTQIKW